jgi:leader peptidase (prepilin peptidase)/N-methyltransferase
MDVLISSALVFALGAAIGSFINVVVYRLPTGQSLLYPASHCPHCGHALAPYDNVPILAWLWLSGRCRHCRRPIAKRYPLTELGSGLVFLISVWRLGWSWWTPAHWVFLSFLLALALIDIETFTLPDGLTQTGLVVGLVAQSLVPGLQGEGLASVLTAMMGGVFGAVLGLWLYEVISLLASLALGQVAMGGGDAKLAAMLGAWLGWQGLLLSSFLACGLGALVGGGAIALGWLHRRQPMAFGPFMAIGAALTVGWGEALVHLYRSLFFPAF